MTTPSAQTVDLDTIEVRCQAATPADDHRWRTAFGVVERVPSAHFGHHAARWTPDDDTAFVLHARTDVPALVAVLRELREGAELVEAFKAGTTDWCIHAEQLRCAVLRLTGGES